MPQFIRFKVLLLISILAAGCLPKNNVEHKLLRLAVPANMPQAEIAGWEAMYRETTNEALEVVTIPQALYRDRVWAALLGGSTQWDVLLVEGSWIAELAEFRAILRVANTQNKGEFFTPYRVDIPLLITRQNQDSELPAEIHKFKLSLSSFVYWIEKTNLTFGFAGVGGIDWLLIKPVGDDRDYKLISPDDSEFILLRKLVCESNSSQLDAQSPTRTAQDLINAVHRGEIDIGILWLSQLQQIDACAESGGDHCADLKGIEVIPFDGMLAPRRISAWVVPARSTQSDKALQFLQLISMGPQLVDLPVELSGVDRERVENAVMFSSAGVSAVMRDDIAERIEGLVFQCMREEIDLSQFTKEYRTGYLMATNAQP